jgi:hypothetical protein
MILERHPDDWLVRVAKALSAQRPTHSSQRHRWALADGTDARERVGGTWRD